MNHKIIKDITPEERNFLIYFRARPGMYIGNNSINHAHIFLLGYRMALYNTDQIDDHRIIPDEFTEYIAFKYDESASMGWCQIILEQMGDEEKALWLFFDLLDEFLLKNGFKPIGETPLGLWYRLRNCICREEIFDNLNIYEVLKKRELQEFKSEWDRVKNEIEAKIKNHMNNTEINKSEISEASDSEEQKIENLYSSKDFYKNIIYDNVCKLCGNEELAENIAKDVDMIYVGSIISYNDSWLNKLIEKYKQYTIPNGYL